MSTIHGLQARNAPNNSTSAVKKAGIAIGVLGPIIVLFWIVLVWYYYFKWKGKRQMGDVQARVRELRAHVNGQRDANTAAADVDLEQGNFGASNMDGAIAKVVSSHPIPLGSHRSVMKMVSAYFKPRSVSRSGASISSPVQPQIESRSKTPMNSISEVSTQPSNDVYRAGPHPDMPRWWRWSAITPDEQPGASNSVQSASSDESSPYNSAQSYELATISPRPLSMDISEAGLPYFPRRGLRYNREENTFESVDLSN
jgi:hypothetical protein